MTAHEKLMYEILTRISAADTPLVFKGALITKLILVEGGYSALERQTKDIDANWVSTPPSMDALVKTINHALGDLKDQFHAVAIRDYEERKSAGIAIVRNCTGDEAVLMDISMKPVMGSRTYLYSEMEIKGVLPNEVLADKISVLSKPIIFRRAKDMVDVYALAHCVSILTHEIHEICKIKPRSHLDTFEPFLTRKSDLEHAFNALKGIRDKPAFDDIYAYLTNFLQPFIQMDETPRIWVSNTQAWEGFELTKEKPKIST